MAESSSDMSSRVTDIITCPICLEVFEDPRSLPCLHAYCRNCLTSLFDNLMPGEEGLCPLCRQPFMVPQNGLDDLVHNFFIQHLLDARNTSSSGTTSDTVSEISKDVVKDLDADMKAVSLRIKCIREHIEQLKDNQCILTEEVEVTKKLILKKGDELKQLVDNQVGELVSKLQSTKFKTLEIVRKCEDKLQLALSKLESFNSYCVEVKANLGSAHDEVHVVSDLHARACELLGTDVVAATAEYCVPFVIFEPAELAEQTLIGHLQIENIAASSLVHTYPDGKPVCGLTSLDNELFVLRLKDTQEIEVYNMTAPYNLLRQLSVPSLEGFADMTSCPQNRCLYISDYISNSVHRVLLLPDSSCSSITSWPVNDEPCGLSVTPVEQHSVLVTCPRVRKLKEFCTSGVLLREVVLPLDFANPWHAVWLSDCGQFVVCHGDPDDLVHRVFTVDTAGSVGLSYGGPNGSNAGIRQLLNVPRHMAVVKDGQWSRCSTVFVVDVKNRRVVRLLKRSTMLCRLRDAVSCCQLNSGDPYRLHINTASRGHHLLYVAENKWMDNEWTAGRVVVFSL